ncbi:YiaA/YiaB family inner membrane protein [Paenibacillus aestuarii]|uniref:YiaA/YiaB family inner membrane protein n=1 Tax=Paenibacillus aestuarii TaxID=516965 RepID=A0ABW0KBN7_9BACL
MAWSSFGLALLGMFIGIINLEEPLSVKGYYAVTALFLTMSSFVLQKTIRDNTEDEGSLHVHMESGEEV